MSDFADGFADGFAMAAEVSAFEHWYGKSTAPEMMYAAGARQPTSSAVWHVAREYERAGLVKLRARATDDGWQWFAVRGDGEKRAAQLAGAAARRAAMNDETGGDDDADDIIHRAFKRAANFGLPAPSYRQLARLADITDRQARSICERLVRAGAIRVQIMEGKRRVQILQNAKVKNSTAWADFMTHSGEGK